MLRPLPLIVAFAGFVLAAVVVAVLSDQPVAPPVAKGSGGDDGAVVSAPEVVLDSPLRIAILDFSRIHQHAEAIQSIEAGYRSAIEAYAEEAKARETELRSAEDALRARETELSPEAYRSERLDLQRRMARAMELVQERKRTLDLARQEGLNEVQLALNAIVTEIATERQLSLILRKEQTVLVATEFDVTDEVLRRLNKRVPSVDVFAPED